ncbi:hypothetical protein ABLA30_18500 [Xenorhabdus nematophila]|uniref:hypothetical protein n=1 Tax=Xenorhabdus nematophila TaxID=628 RepID=UPI00032755E0|nr:hypothetical protein [Xenorhabdus nematophila]CCW29437.1 conserved hypothetical protein [Xenorhabdus nematophila F1]
MDSIEQSKKLRTLFLSLWEIMRVNGGGNWIKGIENVITLLTPPTYGGTNDAQSAIEDARRAYGSMFGDYGGFSEYFIWRDDFNERLKANEALDKIKNDINDTFN